MGMVLTFKVNGEAIQVDLDAELNIVVPEHERNIASSKVATWGAICASADAAALTIRAKMDHWFSKAVSQCILSDEKIAQWKAEAYVSGNDDYLKLQLAHIAAKEVADKAQAVLNGYQRKSDHLKEMVRIRTVPEQNSSGQVGRESTPDPRFQSFRDKRKG
jgi:hypothetical protein